jgi:hypothetical protein
MIAVTEDPTVTIEMVPSLIQAELIPEGGLKLAASRITPATSTKKASEQVRPIDPRAIKVMNNLSLRFTTRSNPDN